MFGADWQVKTSRQAQAWTVEAALPLRSFTLDATPPAPGTIWDFNFGRADPLMNPITWWAVTQGPFNNRDRWGYLLFVGPTLPASPGPPPALSDLSYGEYAIRWTPAARMTGAQLATRISGRDNGRWWSVATAEQANTWWEEPLLCLSHPVSAEAPAHRSFSAVNEANEVVAYTAGRFQAFPRQPPRRPGARTRSVTCWSSPAATTWKSCRWSRSRDTPTGSG